jgi:hypothetical protein
MASEDLDGLTGGSRPIRVPVRGAMAKDGPDRPVPPASAAASLALGRRPAPGTTWCCARAGRRTRCPASRAGPSRAGSRPPAGRRRSWRGARAAVLRGADVVHPGGDGRAQHPQRLVAIPRRPEDPVAGKLHRAVPGPAHAPRAERDGPAGFPPFPVAPPPVGVPVGGPAPGPASAPITGGQTSRSRGRGGSTPGPRRWCWW